MGIEPLPQWSTGSQVQLTTPRPLRLTVFNKTVKFRDQCKEIPSSKISLNYWILLLLNASKDRYLHHLAQCFKVNDHLKLTLQLELEILHRAGRGKEIDYRFWQVIMIFTKLSFFLFCFWYNIKLKKKMHFHVFNLFIDTLNLNPFFIIYRKLQLPACTSLLTLKGNTLARTRSFLYNYSRYIPLSFSVVLFQSSV